MAFAALVVLGYLLGLVPVGLLARAPRQARGHPQGRLREHRRDERLAHVRPLARRPGRAARRPEGLRAGAARDALRLAAPPPGICAGAAAMLGHWRPIFLRFAKGGKMVATCGGVSSASRLGRAHGRPRLARRCSCSPGTRRSPRSSPGSRCRSSRRDLRLSASVDRLRRRRPRRAICFLHRANLRRLRAGTESRFQLRRSPRADARKHRRTRLQRRGEPLAELGVAARAARRPSSRRTWPMVPVRSATTS